MSDSITRSVEVQASVERVWHAISDAQEFGTWFQVKLDGPFRAGAVSTGHITYPGYEHVRWEASVVAIEPPHRLAFTWHPYAVDQSKDYSGETPTLVEFVLEPSGGGTRVTVTESGFDAIPPERRDEALRMNARGWDEQMRNIAAHVDG